MRFWDASAIVPLLVGEPSRAALLQLSLEFVCLDDRLNEAATREGFRIVKG